MLVLFLNLLLIIAGEMNVAKEEIICYNVSNNETRNSDICFPKSITKTPIVGATGVFSVF